MAYPDKNTPRCTCGCATKKQRNPLQEVMAIICEVQQRLAMVDRLLSVITEECYSMSDSLLEVFDKINEIRDTL